MIMNGEFKNLEGGDCCFCEGTILATRRCKWQRTSVRI